MANPSDSTVQNLLPVQAYFDVQGNFQTFIGQGKPFYAVIDPNQSGLHITNSTIDSSVIGGTTPAVAYFTSGYVSVAPTTATGIANKQYVDYYAAGLSWKQPVKAASLSNIASLSGFQTIDSVPLTDGDRVLVKDQSLSKNNGIYVVRSGAWEYAVGADDWQEYVGAIVFVEEGSQAYSAWYSLAQEGGTLGVTSLNWANFSVSSTYSAGTGLTLNAGVFSITNTGVINATYGSATASPVIAVNAQGQITSASNATITPAVGSITGLGTGVATALAINVGSSGSVLVNGGALGTPASGNFSSGTFTWPTFNQNTTGTAAGLSTTLAITSGGTGQTTASAAFNTLSPITTTGDLIIGNGTNSATRLAIGANNTVLTSNGTTASWVAGTSFMVYPGAGIPNSTGSAWGTSYSTTGSGTVVALATNPTLYNPNIDVIDFDTAYATALTAGQMGWNGNNTLGLGMSGGNITQEIGLQTYVYGKASSAITKGQLIKKTGANGTSGVITFAPTTANMTNSGDIIGIAAESIALNGFGYIISTGNIKGFNTTGSSSGETWADGDTLYYNPSGNGLMTKTKPSAPNLKVEVGIVINASSGGSGSVTVEIIHGSQLGGTDSNVQITSPTGGQILSYNQTAQYWSNINLTAGTGISITPTTGGAITIANTVTGGITITDDTTTNATRYLTFTNATSGTITGENVSSTKLQFNPSTGTLSSTIFSTSLGTVSAPSITFTGDTNTGIYSPAADTIAFTEGGVESMRIDSSGNVGIGTTSPNIYGVTGRLLTVSNSTNYAYLTLAGSSGNGGAIDFGNQTIRHAEIASLNGSALAFYTNGTDSGTGLSERMRIDSSGNVGIGTASPSAKLAVVGTGYSPNITLTDAATIAWDTSTGQVATFTFVSSNRTMGAPTNLVNGGFYALAVIQNSGSNTLTWNSVFKWASGTAPTLSTAAGARDYFTFRSDGTNLYQQGASLGVA